MDTNGVTTIDGSSKGHTKLHENHFLSDRARVSEIDGIRGLLKHEQPGVVSFLAGKPNPITFPFESITLNLKPPLDVSSSPTNGHGNGTSNGNGNGHSDVPASIVIDGQDLDNALQYGPSSGTLTLRNWLEDLQEDVHNRKKEGGGWTVTLGSGSQDLMTKAFSACMNPGDPVLLETPLYAGVLPALKLLDAKMVEVDVDEQGLSAVNLERILSEWPADQKRPKIVYSTPTGCNPSGCSASRERKLAVLEVCRKYGVLIFEDDPYYFLAEDLIPSYFELETEVFPEGGHVLRFDSFSKLLSAGLRLGWATGPKAILHAIDVLTATANLHTSAVSQAIAHALLKHWKIEGFLAHSRQVAKFYGGRRKIFEEIAHRHLDGLATWNVVVAGMFLWITLAPSGIMDSYELISKEALARGILCVPGQSFYPNGRVSPHVRVSFSLVDLDHDAELGFSRLADAIRDAQKKLKA